MSRQRKQEKYSESLTKHYETGKKQERLKLSKLHLDIVDTISNLSYLVNQNLEKQSFIVGLVPTNNETISTDKLIISNHYSRKELLSKKSDRDLITKEKDFYPFWNKSCQEMSRQLYAATKIDSCDSGLKSSILCATPVIRNSWFSTELIYLQKKSLSKISLPLFTSLAQESTDCENTSKKSKKIRIYPELTLRKVYKKWFSAARWCYNFALAHQRDCYINKKKQLSKYDLRKYVMDNCPSWVSETPYYFRGESVFDAKQAFVTSKNKSNPKFKSCREVTKSIRLSASNWCSNKNYGYTHYPTHKTIVDGESIKVGNLQINPSEPLCSEMPSEFTILNDRGRWFICFAIEFTPDKPKYNRYIALDPGVRTFLTGFDSSNVLEIGKECIGKITSLCVRLDKIQSRISISKGIINKRLRWKLRKQSQALRVRVSNLINELHNKSAACLTKNYNHIFLPKFESQNMVVKTKRKIRSKTARNLLTLSHYKFKQTLKFHAFKRGSVVHDVTEEYTSKTCSKCGHVHPKLGGNKKFVCGNCGNDIPRDWNGAINIFIKSLNIDLINALDLSNAG